MKNSERGNVALWALVTSGILVILVAGLVYRYRSDLRRYQNGPHAAIHRFGRQRLPGKAFRPAMPSSPAYTITGALQNRPVVYKELPEYPSWAEEQGVSGRVRLAFRVNNDGEVYPTIWVTQTLGRPELDEVAINALKHWKFAPINDLKTVSAPVDLYNEPTPGQAGVINFTFTLARPPIRL